MINYLEALRLITQHVSCLGTEKITTQNALGAISAETLSSSEALPAFNNSAMDGFALCAADTRLASQENPLPFTVLKTIAAGDTITHNTQAKGNACEIMTGAMIPHQYDAVVRSEDVTILTQENGQLQKISISQPLAHHENLRCRAEDFSPGDVLIKKNEPVTPEHILAFSALGIDTISVYKKPRIAIVCTGTELLNDDTTTPCQPGQIRNANGPYLANTLASWGFDVSYHGSIPDDPSLFMARIEEIQNTQPDIILSTGAVSAGKWDFIPDTLNKWGADIIFHKVKIKPGKPILFAKLNTGPYFLGLPGNPIASVVALRFFVYPLLRHLLGMPRENGIPARVISHGHKKSDLRHFLKSHIFIDANGQSQVTILPGQESFKIKPLLDANCWAVLNEDCREYTKTDILEVYPLHPSYLFGEDTLL